MTSNFPGYTEPAHTPFVRSVVRIAALAALVSWILPTVPAMAGPPEPEGYRMEAFRAPVPDSLQGATTVKTEQVWELWEAKAAIFIDVLPRPPKPKDLPEGTVWRDRPRNNIPGSVWLPNVGFGALNRTVEAYFRDNLERLTAGDKSKAILIYCQVDCWMSWNAAKRALEYGYSQVYWYPDGTEGWAISGGRLIPSEPEPLTR